MLTVRILTRDNIYTPVVFSGLSWNTERKSSPGSVKFDMLIDDKFNFSVGDIVAINEDGRDFFLGYIFGISLDQTGTYSITAYDQLRYFKNKDTRVYKSLPANGLLRSIAAEFGLTVGDCDATGYNITRVEEDAELFDVMNNAIAETVYATGNLYVLFDDFGKLRLKSIDKLILPIMILETSAQGFKLSTSIDSETYNQIKLAYGDLEKSGLKYYIARDSSTIGKWGLLQKYAKVDKAEGAEAQAQTMLKMYNTPTKTFELKGVVGDVSVRAGTMVYVFGNNRMLVESAKHSWSDGVHTMDLKLKGGAINDG